MDKRKIYVGSFTKGHQYKDDQTAPESPWAYFHGRLYYDLGCDIEGHDLVYLKYCPAEYLGISNSTLMMNTTGCIPVDVLGIEKPCIGFFWTIYYTDGRWCQRGLICYADDTETIMFARKKMINRAKYL